MMIVGRIQSDVYDDVINTGYIDVTIIEDNECCDDTLPQNVYSF